MNKVIQGRRDLKRSYKKTGEELFTRARRNRTRHDGFKRKGSRSKLDIRKKLFTVRMVRHWSRLLREAVDAPSLRVFKVRLDGVLSNLEGILISWKVFQPMARGLELDVL